MNFVVENDMTKAFGYWNGYFVSNFIGWIVSLKTQNTSFIKKWFIDDKSFLFINWTPRFRSFIEDFVTLSSNPTFRMFEQNIIYDDNLRWLCHNSMKMDSLHLIEKQLPESTFNRKTLSKIHIICQKLTFARTCAF